MTLPSRAELRHPIMHVLSERASMHTDDIYSAIAARIGADPADLELTIRTGEPLLRHRVWHALDSLKKDGLVVKPENAWWKLTPSGHASLRATT